jgi:hypothetical protein
MGTYHTLTDWVIGRGRFSLAPQAPSSPSRPRRLAGLFFSTLSVSDLRARLQAGAPTPYRGPPVTLGHLRSHGCRRLLIFCSTGLCHHSAVVDADRWPHDTAIRDLCPRAVCTQCGLIGADVRPNWQERSEQESLTGAQ